MKEKMKKIKKRILIKLNILFIIMNFKSLPTMFISECVMIYMEPTDSDAIVQWISKNIPTAMIMAYEQILPNDSFGQMMIKNLKVNIE